VKFESLLNDRLVASAEKKDMKQLLGADFVKLIVFCTPR
jgi:hypothetical protein